MSLSFDRVDAAYGGHRIFSGATFELPQGQLLGLIGPNGAGKTTLLRIAAGLMRPAGGVVTRSGPVMYFGGEATLPGGCAAERWSRLVGASRHATARLGLSTAAARLRRLSRGTRQLVGLGAWLSRDDWSVGLLDEPWEGLDPGGARWLRAMLERHEQRGASLLISSHRLHDVAEVCSSYAFLARGRLRVVTQPDAAGASGRLDARELARMFEEL